MYRNIETKLKEWSNERNKKPLVLLGVRQPGKSYIIEKLCKENYKKFVKVNLFEDNNFLNIYKETLNYTNRIKIINYTYNINFKDTNTILFVDEVQKCPLFIQDLK